MGYGMRFVLFKSTLYSIYWLNINILGENLISLGFNITSKPPKPLENIYSVKQYIN